MLLVESDPELRATTEKLLGELDYDVFVANSFEDALRVLSKGNDVDLVLTNILLLGFASGVQLGHAVQARRPGTKIAFLTEPPKERPKRSCSDSKGTALAHPFTRVQLNAHLQKAFAKSAAVV